MSQSKNPSSFPPVVKACARCGNRDITWAARAVWHVPSQSFRILDVGGDQGCSQCSESVVADVPLTFVEQGQEARRGAREPNPFETFRDQVRVFTLREYVDSFPTSEEFTEDFLLHVRRVLVYPGDHIIEELLQGAFLEMASRPGYGTAHRTRGAAEAQLFNALLRGGLLPEQDQAALAGCLVGKGGAESEDKSADDGTNRKDRDMNSKKYTIATLGDILIVTAPDGSDDIRAIAEREVQSQHYSTNSVEIEYTSGLTLANALPEGAECIYSGIETGWLEDEDGINYRYAYHA